MPRLVVTDNSASNGSTSPVTPQSFEHQRSFLHDAREAKHDQDQFVMREGIFQMLERQRGLATPPSHRPLFRGTDMNTHSHEVRARGARVGMNMGGVVARRSASREVLDGSRSYLVALDRWSRELWRDRLPVVTVWDLFGSVWLLWLEGLRFFGEHAASFATSFIHNCLLLTRDFWLVMFQVPGLIRGHLYGALRLPVAPWIELFLPQPVTLGEYWPKFIARLLFFEPHPYDEIHLPSSAREALTLKWWHTRIHLIPLPEQLLSAVASLSKRYAPGLLTVLEDIRRGRSRSVRSISGADTQQLYAGPRLLTMLEDVRRGRSRSLRSSSGADTQQLFAAPRPPQAVPASKLEVSPNFDHAIATKHGKDTFGSTVQFPVHPNSHWYYINGIFASKSMTINQGLMLESMFGQPIKLVYNATLGPVLDLIEVMFGRTLNLSTADPTRRLFNLLDAQLRADLDKCLHDARGNLPERLKNDAKSVRQQLRVDFETSERAQTERDARAASPQSQQREEVSQGETVSDGAPGASRSPSQQPRASRSRSSPPAAARKLVVIAHSQGSIVVANALELLREKYRMDESAKSSTYSQFMCDHISRAVEVFLFGMASDRLEPACGEHVESFSNAGDFVASMGVMHPFFSRSIKIDHDHRYIADRLGHLFVMDYLKHFGRDYSHTNSRLIKYLRQKSAAFSKRRE